MEIDKKNELKYLKNDKSSTLPLVNLNNFIAKSAHNSHTLSKFLRSIFTCFYIRKHVSWESWFCCCVGHKLEQFIYLRWLDRDKLEHIYFIQLLTSIAMKLWLTRNMLQNIKTHEKGWLKFSENLIVMVKKIAWVNSIGITKSINLH